MKVRVSNWTRATLAKLTAADVIRAEAETAVQRCKGEK